VNYHAYGLTLASSIHLPELPRSHHGSPDLSITLGSGRLEESGWRWVQRADERGAWLDVGHRPGAHRLRFESGGDFVVSDENLRVRVYPAPSVAPHTLRHLLLDQVVPLVISHRGCFVLHASAFVTGSDAVAFIGPAGAGKSTLAASFCTNGAHLLADDALVVSAGAGGLIANPAYPGVRLWPDVAESMNRTGVRSDWRVASYTDKRRLGTRHGLSCATSPASLRRIYMLSDEKAANARITRLSAREAIMALLAHTYVLDVSDRKRIGDRFARVCAMSPAADVRLLAYTRTLDGLARVRDAVLADTGAR
jgi:hypothetical protein